MTVKGRQLSLRSVELMTVNLATDDYEVSCCYDFTTTLTSYADCYYFHDTALIIEKHTNHLAVAYVRLRLRQISLTYTVYNKRPFQV